MKKKIIFLVSISIIIIIFLVFNVNKNDIDKQENNALVIETKDYYEYYRLSNNNIDDKQSYILYFHQRDCSSCMDTNYIVDKYISLGYENLIPLYIVCFNDEKYIFDKYMVSETPTLYFFNNGNEAYLVGKKNICDFLNDLVIKANKYRK